jgi:hypothetical protein
MYQRFLASPVSTRHRFVSGDQFHHKHRIWIAGGHDQHWEAEVLLKMTQWRRKCSFRLVGRCEMEARIVNGSLKTKNPIFQPHTSVFPRNFEDLLIATTRITYQTKGFLKFYF